MSGYAPIIAEPPSMADKQAKTSRGCQEYSNPAYVHSPESGRKPNGVTPSTSQANLQVPSNGETNSAGSSPGSSRRSSIVDVAIAMTTVVKETNASGVVGASMMTSSASTVANGQNVPGVSGRNGPSPPQMGPRPLKSALVNSSPVTDSISILAQLKRAQARYTHPYGNSATILEELLYGDDDDFVQPAGKIQESSNAKLVVWITFCVFMVGMAGAIILGAESFKQRNDAFASRNLTSVLSNGTLT